MTSNPLGYPLVVEADRAIAGVYHATPPMLIVIDHAGVVRVRRLEPGVGDFDELEVSLVPLRVACGSGSADRR